MEHLLSELRKVSEHEHSPYTEKDYQELMAKNGLKIKGMEVLVQLVGLLRVINSNHVSTRKEWHSYSMKSKQDYMTELTFLLQKCAVKDGCVSNDGNIIDTMCTVCGPLCSTCDKIVHRIPIHSTHKRQTVPYQIHDGMYDTRILTKMVIDLFSNQLSSSYIHKEIPVLIEQCMLHIKKISKEINLQKRIMVRINLEKMWTCPICLEHDATPDNPYVWLTDNEGETECGHKLHLKCYEGILDGKCPLCRREFIGYAKFRINENHEGRKSKRNGIKQLRNVSYKKKGKSPYKCSK